MNSTVLIDEATCIGCTKCIQVCPVDAIFGASKYLHTVIQDECIGCNLCIPACPVDCISIQESPKEWSKEERLARAQNTRERVQVRKQRLQIVKMPALGSITTLDKKAQIALAIAKAKMKS
jgi:electron transport complex protein RnfB